MARIQEGFRKTTRLRVRVSELTTTAWTIATHMLDTRHTGHNPGYAGYLAGPEICSSPVAIEQNGWSMWVSRGSQYSQVSADMKRCAKEGQTVLCGSNVTHRGTGMGRCGLNVAILKASLDTHTAVMRRMNFSSTQLNQILKITLKRHPTAKSPGCSDVSQSYWRSECPLVLQTCTTSVQRGVQKLL
ncbi:hypothetical protein RRG08_014385 [Elysia crispata]|uniref:Uncharacterized protein n=1 Tax=Elysia crispata TaxID=231223 RepID=A0AAE1D2I6_9GAST|nr:hypothetical protein RRG08_014385 [Elysia crispata]